MFILIKTQIILQIQNSKTFEKISKVSQNNAKLLKMLKFVFWLKCESVKNPQEYHDRHCYLLEKSSSTAYGPIVTRFGIIKKEAQLQYGLPNMLVDEPGKILIYKDKMIDIAFIRRGYIMALQELELLFEKLLIVKLKKRILML